jgi:hypothetical protein
MLKSAAPILNAAAEQKKIKVSEAFTGFAMGG